MTNSQVTSDVVNSLRAVTLDDRISERFVLAKLRDCLGTYLKRENDVLRLYYYSDIFTTISCLEMEPIDSQSCLGIDIPKVNTYMWSKEVIPTIYSYKNGPIIREIFPIDEGNSYQPSSPIDFIKVTKREFQGPLRYYWFRNGHLVLPVDPNRLTAPEAVLVTACFIEQNKALSLCTCNKVTCVDPMEDEFPCPPHLLSTVKQETLKDLFNFYKRNIIDALPDSDPNSKSEKPDVGSK